jgi:cation diffusion facilitator family transporter
MALGLYLAQQPADESHPQGHSRFEPLVSLFIAVAMVVAGFTAMREGVLRFLSGALAIDPGWPTVVLVGSALVKVAMYVLVGRIGRLARSPAIHASARDNLSDVLTSTAAMLGVWGSRFVHPLLDPVAGVVVSLWIFRAAGEILYENLGYLTGRCAPPELVAQIVTAASSVPGVLNVHQVIADHVGPRVRVDMHIDLDGEMTLHQAHAIADRVHVQVEALPTVDLAFVHVEPAGAYSGEKSWENITVQLRRLANGLGGDVHNVWAYEVDGNLYADVHLEVDGTLSLRDAHALASSFEEQACAEIAHLVELTTHIEPRGRLTSAPDSGLEKSQVLYLVRQMLDETAGDGTFNQLEVRRSGEGWAVSLHCLLPGELSLVAAHQANGRLEAQLMEKIPGLERVIIHTEPMEK